MTDISTIIAGISQNSQATLDSYEEILMDIVHSKGGTAAPNQNLKSGSGITASGSSGVNGASGSNPLADSTVLAIGDMCYLYMLCKQDLAAGGTNTQITAEIAEYLSKLEATVASCNGASDVANGPSLKILLDATNMISCLQSQSPLSADTAIVALWENGETSPYEDATNYISKNDYSASSVTNMGDGFALCMFLFAGAVNPLTKLGMQSTLETILGGQGTGASAAWLMSNFLSSYNFASDPVGRTYVLSVVLPPPSPNTPNYNAFLADLENCPAPQPGDPSTEQYWQDLSYFMPN